jgi:hypothetical protein
MFELLGVIVFLLVMIAYAAFCVAINFLFFLLSFKIYRNKYKKEFKQWLESEE